MHQLPVNRASGRALLYGSSPDSRIIHSAYFGVAGTEPSLSGDVVLIELISIPNGSINLANSRITFFRFISAGSNGDTSFVSRWSGAQLATSVLYISNEWTHQQPFQSTRATALVMTTLEFDC